MIIIVIVVIVFAVFFIKQKVYDGNLSSQSSETNDNENYLGAYQSKYLFSLNEKSAFKKLSSWANDKDFYVFPKVRVLDIIEPRKNSANYKKLFWKIQAKHIDFVICDKDLKIKFLIELDDNSHKQQKRVERDEFLQQALSGAGYNVIHTYSINESFLASLNVA